MNGRKQLGLLCAGALVLSGCASERTVLSTDSRVSFTEGWSSQLGDEKKMKEKYASGFEIKEGRAVATGDKPSPFEGKEFSKTEFRREAFSGSGEEVSKKEFSGGKRYLPRPFQGVRNAPDGDQRSGWQGQSSSWGDDRFVTRDWSGSERRADTGAAPESGKKFAFPRGGNREAPLAAGAERVRVDPTSGTPLPAGQRTGTMLSVEDVRKMLSPELYQ